MHYLYFAFLVGFYRSPPPSSPMHTQTVIEAYSKGPLKEGYMYRGQERWREFCLRHGRLGDASLVENEVINLTDRGDAVPPLKCR